MPGVISLVRRWVFVRWNRNCMRMLLEKSIKHETKFQLKSKSSRYFFHSWWHWCFWISVPNSIKNIELISYAFMDIQYSEKNGIPHQNTNRNTSISRFIYHIYLRVMNHIASRHSNSPIINWCLCFSVITLDLFPSGFQSARAVETSNRASGG